MTPTVRVSHLTKEYKTLGGRLDFLRLLFRAPVKSAKALSDVSFDVTRGTVFGLVGENGAGKSTLLSILAGTVFPTAGSCQVQGRISSLLEIGSGFHPEFSGRQNIFFSGALAGRSRREIEHYLDEIIKFSELGDALDRPVRTYSTGMFLRLGFALATSFEPEVLLVDEHLSVGDERFQRKCMRRIRTLQDRGVTMVICSHNLGLLKTLCEGALWLREGSAELIGDIDSVAAAYSSFLKKGPTTSFESADSRTAPLCEIRSVQLTTPDGSSTAEVRTGESICVEVVATFAADFGASPAVGLAIVRADGLIVYGTSTAFDEVQLLRLDSDTYRCRLLLPELPLLAGRYYVNVAPTDDSGIQPFGDVAVRALEFTVVGSEKEKGVCKLTHQWS